MSKKTIQPQPYLATMTYDENCWLVIDCRSKGNDIISFYNQKQDPDKEFSTITEFAECYIDNELGKFDEHNIEHKHNCSVASGVSTSEEDDFDEDSRKSWKTTVASGQIIEIMTGIKLENIYKELLRVENDLENMREDNIDSAKDAAEERADPYGYRGLKRSDFI